MRGSDVSEAINTYNYHQVNRLCTVRERATATPLGAHPCSDTGGLVTGKRGGRSSNYDRYGNQRVAQHGGANMPYSELRRTQQSNIDANTNRLAEVANLIGYDAAGQQTRYGGWNLSFDAEGRAATATPSAGSASSY